MDTARFNSTLFRRETVFGASRPEPKWTWAGSEAPREDMERVLRLGPFSISPLQKDRAESFLDILGGLSCGLCCGEAGAGEDGCGEAGEGEDGRTEVLDSGLDIREPLSLL